MVIVLIVHRKNYSLCSIIITYHAQIIVLALYLTYTKRRNLIHARFRTMFCNLDKNMIT